MKKALAIFLLICLTFCVAACGKSKDNTTNPVSGSNTTVNAVSGVSTTVNAGLGSTTTVNVVSALNTTVNSTALEEDGQDVGIDETAAMREYTTNIITQADQMVAAQDYTGALELLNKAKNVLNEKTAEQSLIKRIETKIEEVNKAYAVYYARLAKEAFNSKNAEGAVSNIESALSLDPGNAEYVGLQVEYRKYLPFPLYLEDNMLSVKEDPFYRKEEVANNNQTMTNSIMWTPLGSDYEAVTYSLGGVYDSVSGIIYYREEYKSADYTGYIEAYGDGKLIYTSPVVGKDILPQQINFNVSGIQKLTLRFYGSPNSTAYYDASAFGVSEIIARKDFPN